MAGQAGGVVYMTELLTLPSSPSSPGGWPGEVLLEGLTPTPVPRPQAPASCPQAGSRMWLGGWGMPVVPPWRPLEAEACGRVQRKTTAAGGLEEAGQGRLGGWASPGPRACHCHP